MRIGPRSLSASSVLQALSRGGRRIRRKASMFMSRRRLKRIAGPTGRLGADEIVLISKVRNEALRLPFFLRYYRDLGVDRFVIVDNGSTDRTVELLSKQDDVVVYETDEPLDRHQRWIEILLARHGMNRWCVVADADELLVLPSRREIDLPTYARFLSDVGHSAVRAILVDMYPARPEVHYIAGEDPLTYCDRFDGTFTETSTLRLNERTQRWFETVRFAGGTRERLFGVDVNLTKIPFFRNAPRTWLAGGAHAVDGASISDGRAVVLHFKYLDDYVERTVDGARRGVYADGAGYYSAIAAQISSAKPPEFVHQGSLEFRSFDDLSRAGLISEPAALATFLEGRDP